jgi:hypothetical protein
MKSVPVGADSYYQILHLGSFSMMTSPGGEAVWLPMLGTTVEEYAALCGLGDAGTIVGPRGVVLAMTKVLTAILTTVATKSPPGTAVAEYLYRVGRNLQEEWLAQLHHKRASVAGVLSRRAIRQDGDGAPRGGTDAVFAQAQGETGIVRAPDPVSLIIITVMSSSWACGLAGRPAQVLMQRQ